MLKQFSTVCQMYVRITRIYKIFDLLKLIFHQKGLLQCTLDCEIAETIVSVIGKRLFNPYRSTCGWVTVCLSATKDYQTHSSLTSSTRPTFLIESASFHYWCTVRADSRSTEIHKILTNYILICLLCSSCKNVVVFVRAIV